MFIKKKFVSADKTLAKKIMNTTDVEDKDNNTYSCAIVDQFNTYSTDEIVVGTWTDNKPLYRKTYSCTVSASGTQYTTNLNISNLNQVHSVYGMLYSSDGRYFPINSYIGSSIFTYAFCNSAVVAYYSQAYTGTMSISVEYTKTTD